MNWTMTLNNVAQAQTLSLSAIPTTINSILKQSVFDEDTTWAGPAITSKTSATTSEMPTTTDAKPNSSKPEPVTRELSAPDFTYLGEGTDLQYETNQTPEHTQFCKINNPQPLRLGAVLSPIISRLDHQAAREWPTKPNTNGPQNLTQMVYKQSTNFRIFHRCQQHRARF